jgi:multidrug resistance efflux pump
MELAQCNDFYLTVLASPPRAVHATAWLLATTLAAVFAWSALTEADLVVRAPGRVRPTAPPTQIVNLGPGESTGFGDRVAEVLHREGDRVHRGELLVRLETHRLDNEIVKRSQTIRAGEEDLEKHRRLGRLQDEQSEMAQLKAEAEVAHAREEGQLARERREAEIRLARVEHRRVSDEAARLEALGTRLVIPPSELLGGRAKLREAEERLRKASIPVDEGRVLVLGRALDLAARDHAVRREELDLKRAAKLAEVEAARVDLVNLRLEREKAFLRSPIDGVVTSGRPKIGDVLERGKPVLEVAGEGDFLFEASVSNEDVGHLRPGLPARVKLDAYDYQRYGTVPGLVSFLSPDSGVQPESGSGKERPIYLLRVELPCQELARGTLRGRLKLGMTGTTEIITGRQTILSIVVRKVRRSISLG